MVLTIVRDSLYTRYAIQAVAIQGKNRTGSARAAQSTDTEDSRHPSDECEHDSPYRSTEV